MKGSLGWHLGRPRNSGFVMHLIISNSNESCDPITIVRNTKSRDVGGWGLEVGRKYPNPFTTLPQTPTRVESWIRVGSSQLVGAP